MKPLFQNDAVNNLPMTYASWEQYLSQIWCDLFEYVQLNKSSIILEIAPGRSPKIALALAQYCFQGTVIIVEPLLCAQKDIIAIYSKLLPNATIYGIGQPLKKCINQLPHVDIVASHSPLDDMLIAGNCTSQTDLQQLFNWTQKIDLKVEEHFKLTWDNLISDSYQIQTISENIIEDWNNFLKFVKPKACIISQYHSLVLKEQGLHSLNIKAQNILYHLKKIHQNLIDSDHLLQLIFNNKMNYNFSLIKDEVLNAKNWMVYRHK